MDDEQHIIYRVQNDTGPDEQFVIKRKVVDPDTEAVTYEPVTDISAAVLVIKSLTTLSITNDAHQDCTIDTENSTATYRFRAGDLPDAGGDYECDLETTDGSGNTETYFKKIRIKTRAEIAA